MKTNCLYCSTSFNARETDLKRGRSKFCSHSCSSKFYNQNRILPKNNVFCSWCNKEFYKQESSIKRSKSGLFFCCREHKDLAARLKGGIKKIQPAFYGLNKEYRTKAFRNFPNFCNRCQYNKCISALQVHHKDRNRKNNELSNLEILCANCHAEEHHLD